MNTSVYRKGQWIQYTFPSDASIYWNENQKLQATSFYATAISKGLSPSQSAILTECYMNKQIYPGLQYIKSIESQLQSFLV